MSALVAISAAGCGDGDSVLFAGLSDDLNRELEELRTATEPFRELENAHDVGYETLVTHPTNGNRCLRHVQLGAMGFHYLNPDLVDDSVSVASPEVLIYEPQANGSLDLVGVEYIIPFSITPDDEAAPILFDREFKRNYTFDVWALHAWAWRDNPSGAFTDWNADVSCEHAVAVE